MQFLRRHGKRIAIDIAGFGLIVLGILLGPLPGPGGIPLIIGGLGLLSINNVWAANLRNYLLKNGGQLVKVLFPPTAWVQWLYDALVLALLGLVAFLSHSHSAVWQISVAIAGFFFALFIAAMNRDRYLRIKHKLKR